MVFVDLILVLKTENIKEILIENTWFEWHFLIKCTNCQNEHDKFIYFSEDDKVEMSKGGKGQCNFSLKCKECSKEMYITVYEKSAKKIICEETGNTTKVFSTFELRGCDLVTWQAKEGITAVATESDQKFENIDLTDVWVDYDDSANQNVQVELVEYKFERNNKLK